MNLILNLIVVAASVLGSGMALPQARRLVKTRNIDGISPIWIGVSMGVNAWWTAYALATSLWALLPVSSVSLVLYAAMAVTYLQSAGSTRRQPLTAMAVGAFGLGMVPLPFLVLGGWEVAGLAIGLAYGIQLAPAVVAAFRTRRLDGVSAGTWIISFVEAVLWLIYGALINDAALFAGGTTGVVMAGAILTRLVSTGHQPFAIRPAMRTA